VHGTKGSFTKFGLDPQEDTLKTGQRPQRHELNGWGADLQAGDLLSIETIPGVATPLSVRRSAPNPAGNYLNYYAQLRDHLWGLAPEPLVTPAQVRAVMQLLALGEHSATQGRFVAVAASR
jgi:predicted dehydrogenase